MNGSAVTRGTVVGPLDVSSRHRSEIKRVVLIFDGEDDTMQGSDQFSGRGKFAIKFSRDLECVRHSRIIVRKVGQAARLSIVESPFFPRGGTKVQGLQRIDLPRVRNG